jgi:hypothetical protein
VVWQELLAGDPRPAVESCEVQARHLNAHIGYGAARRIRAREDAEATAAVRLLIARGSKYLEPPEAPVRSGKFPQVNRVRRLCYRWKSSTITTSSPTGRLCSSCHRSTIHTLT